MKLLEDAEVYMNTQNMNYSQEDQYIHSIIFSWKLITDQDSILSMRSPNLYRDLLKPVLEGFNTPSSLGTGINFKQ